MRPFFKEMFKYAHHSNQKLISELIKNEDKVSEYSVKLISHVVNAHAIWNGRINGRPATSKVWDKRMLAEVKTANEENFDAALKIVDSEDFERTITYVNSQGIEYTNNIRDVLFHVVNHCTYHRGQINADLRRNGMQPVVDDFIAYKR